MRFSTVAASFAFFSGALGAVVYETVEQTITSCGPEVTNCPARSHSATATAVAATSSVVSVPAVSTPVSSAVATPSSVASVPVAPIGTGVSSVPAVPIGTGAASVPAVPVVSAASSVVPAVPVGTGAVGTAPVAPIASGTIASGLPGAALNTSTPVAPSQPSGSTFEGAASLKSFSAVAALAAAGALFLA
jgi:hypothetical protein